MCFVWHPAQSKGDLMPTTLPYERFSDRLDDPPVPVGPPTADRPSMGRRPPNMIACYSQPATPADPSTCKLTPRQADPTTRRLPDGSHHRR